MKRIKNILFLLSALVYIVLVSGFISNTEKTRRIGEVRIKITDSASIRFIDRRTIEKILEDNGFNPVGKSMSEFNVGKIEEALRSKQIIKDAEIFVTEPGIVQVEISQKEPFLRIYNRFGQGYYLDREGNIIPLSSDFSPFVIVANGYISEPFVVSRTLNILNAKPESVSRSHQTIYDVYELAGYLASDDFLSSQFEQIYVNNKFEIELIPRVGAHIIELGKVEDLSEKLSNLKILYTKGLNNLGWNQYDKISLKYKNQVVCTKIQ